MCVRENITRLLAEIQKVLVWMAVTQNCLHPFESNIIKSISVRKSDPENVVLEFEVLLLSGLQAGL